MEIMDIKKLTLDQINNYITVINLMIKENVIDFNPDNAKATFKYGNAMAYLENQNIKQEKEIEKLKHENTKLNEIWLYIGELPPHEHNSTIDARKIISRYYEEVEKLNNIINEAREKSIKLQEKYGYILDDLTYLLMQNKNL